LAARASLAAVVALAVALATAPARAEEPARAPQAPEPPLSDEPPRAPESVPLLPSPIDQAPPAPEPPAVLPAPPIVIVPPPGAPPTPIVAVTPARPRPRLSAAVGMGVSLDDTGLPATKAIPSFFASGGVGVDWPVGFDLLAFSSASQGRYVGTPVDRLALDATSVLRPFAWSVSAADVRYGAQLERATGLELGLGLERDGTTVKAGSRVGLHTGARVEIPLGLPGYASELRLRLAARYLVGFYTPHVQDIAVGNSVELYGALVTVF
jgi:hypothetical protein